MSAIIKSLPIPWTDLPGTAKDRLTNDALLLAQDSAAIQDTYYMDILLGLNPSKLVMSHISNHYQFDIVKFRNTVERLIRRSAREVNKNNNRTSLSDWFSEMATTLHRATKQDTTQKLATVRSDLSNLLFGINGSEVKAYFVTNPDPSIVNKTVLFEYLINNGLNTEISQRFVSKLDNIVVDVVAVQVRTKTKYLNQANILGLHSIREFLTEEQLLLITIVSYGLAANMVNQYVIGKYSLITLACNIIFGVGYREFKQYALAEKVGELSQRPLEKIINILENKYVPEYYIIELKRFFV